MPDSSGIVAERVPIMPDEAGGVAALSWDATRLPAPLGGTAGLPALSRGEAELLAQVVTIKDSTRIQG